MGLLTLVGRFIGLAGSDSSGLDIRHGFLVQPPSAQGLQSLATLKMWALGHKVGTGSVSREKLSNTRNY